MMSLFRNPHRKLLYLVLALFSIGLAAAIVWLRLGIERPTPDPQIEHKQVRVPLRPYDRNAGPVEDVSRTPKTAGAEVSCDLDVVWTFVEAAGTQAADCSTFPTMDRLEQLDCHGIEWAVLDSGCIPPGAYFDHERLHSRNRHDERHTAYCKLVDFEGWQIGQRYVSLTDAGEVTCVGTERTCSQAPSCANIGTCSAGPDGKCQPTRVEDCKGSHTCPVTGACSLVDGACAPASDAECAASNRCETDGLCVERNNECVASSEGCANAHTCRSDGACDSVDGSCAPTADEHCQNSDICTLYGRCAVRDGTCVAESTAACQASEHCEKSGECVAFQGQCRRASHSICEQSDACHDDGKCAAIDGVCAHATDAGCEASDECADRGRCTARDGRCVVGGQDDCDKIEGADFTFDDGYCERVDTPAQSTQRTGRVVSDEHLPADFDCSQTTLCEQFDYACTTDVRPVCLDGSCDGSYAACVTDDDICSELRSCDEKGRCETAKPGVLETKKALANIETCFERDPLDSNGYCVRRMGMRCERNEVGCQNSKGCKELGHCSTRSRSKMCVATEPSHCLESEACAAHGACGMVPTSTYHTCGATKAWHCAQSEACEDEGACFLSGGTCETADVLGIEGDCEQTEACERWGECTLVDRNGTCAPTEPSHCRQSEACREQGKCAVVDGRCVATTQAHCAASSGCKDEGRCELRHGSCHTEAFARALDAICPDGRARDIERTCEPHDPNANNHWRAADSKPCREQEQCQTRGNCRRSKYAGYCEPGSVQHCEDSRECATRGECGMAIRIDYRGPGRTFCAPTRDAHCAGTLGCIEDGKCGHVVVPREALYGAPDHQCAPTRPEHCRESVACHLGGRCAYRNGECVQG